MEQWSLIQNQPLLKTIYLKRPIISYKRGKSLKDTPVVRPPPKPHEESVQHQKWRTFTREKPGRYEPVLWFLRRQLISTEEAHFYRGGSFLLRKLISTEETDFYRGGWFLRSELISTAEADFHWGGQFLSNRLIFEWKAEQLHRESKVFIRNVFVLQCAAVAPVGQLACSDRSWCFVDLPQCCLDSLGDSERYSCGQSLHVHGH